MEGLLLLLLSAVGTGGGTWTVAADEEGVRVEQLEGAETPLQEFRAEGVVGASPEACPLRARHRPRRIDPALARAESPDRRDPGGVRGAEADGRAAEPVKRGRRTC
jgi:hypothetical protein